MKKAQSILTCLLFMTACDDENELRSVSTCTIQGDVVDLDVNTYGINVGDDFLDCTDVSVEAETLMLHSLDGAPYMIGHDIHYPDAAGVIEVDTLLYDGETAEPANYPQIPCDPKIQCCARSKKRKIWVKTTPTPPPLP